MNSKSDTIDAEIDEQYNKIVKQFDSVHVPAPQRKAILAAHHEIIRLEKAKLEANQEALLLRERIDELDRLYVLGEVRLRDKQPGYPIGLLDVSVRTEQLKAELSRLSGEESHE